MDKLNRAQRIAIVISLAWFAATVWYFWQEYPTAEKLSAELLERRSNAEATVGKVRDEALRQCKLRFGDDLLKDLIAGCTHDAQKKHYDDFKWVFEGHNEWSQLEFERLPARQNKVLLKILLVGALLPLLVYFSVAWIARAPKQDRA